MADTVKVPGMGHQKKAVVFIFGGIAVAVVGVALWRRHQANTAATAQTAAVTTAGTNAIDPATGYEYGSAEDAAALSSQNAYNYPTDYSGLSGVGGALPVAYTGNSYGSTTGFIDNATWSQAAVSILSGYGLPSTDVSAALGQYLTGHPPSNATYSSYIEQAIAAVGLPPVPGINGYPPSIANSPPIPPPTTTAAKNYKYVVQKHQISVATSGRALIQRFSMAGATPNEIETALSTTVNDAKNASYRAYYAAHNGNFPAKAGLYVTTVQKA